MGVQLPSEPINRQEQYLAKIAGQAVEIPEEPITREEAYLDYIAKHGGGGGGGTNDYDDLLNQPKINNVTLKGNKSAENLGLASKTTVDGILNGTDIDSFGDVESALTDKADKSAVRKEFIGTLAEWNALTTAQQKAYDTYQITDDYSEALMPNYSTTEQKTGQKWIDGKDIYFRTFDLGSNVSFSSSTWVNMSTYISIAGWDKPVGGAWGASSDGICLPLGVAVNGGYLEIKIDINSALRYLTFYYTKA